MRFARWLVASLVRFAVAWAFAATHALAVNNAAFVSQFVPASMIAGTTYDTSVTLQNTGDTTWTRTALYRLGAQNPQEVPVWNVLRVPLPTASVAPGATVTFNFKVVAPNTAGLYNFSWKMVQDGVAFFGVASPTQVVTVTGSNRAQYIYDEIGRLVEAVAVNGDSVRYAYDAEGNITSIARHGVNTVSISEFTPDRGLGGTAVTIYGSGFSTTPASNTVTFNGAPATVTAATATSLTATVPAAATTGPITVSNTNGSGTSLTSFVVGAPLTQAPTITGFTPTAGAAGTSVTITGSGFQTPASANVVRFGMAPATAMSATPTQIVAAALPGASGKISVTTPYGTGTSAADFFALPSGSVAGEFQRFLRLSIGAAATPVAITTAGRKAALIFDGVQGQWVSLVLTGGTFAPARATATAYRVDGSVLATKVVNSNDRLDFRLPTTGTYTVVISTPSDTAGAVNVRLVAALTAQLTVGAASTFTLSSGQMGVFTFIGTARTTKWVDFAGYALADRSDVSLLDPLGTALLSTPISGQTTGPFSFERGGIYTILVQPQGVQPAGTVTMKVADGPDLQPTSLTVGAITISQNGSYTIPVTYTVRNNGGVTARGQQGWDWTDHCFVSANATLGAEDPGIGSTQKSALAPGASYTVSYNCFAPSTTAAGTHTLFVKTDTGVQNGVYDPSANGVIETNEANNVMSATITLPGRPDLVAKALSIAAVSVGQGGEYYIPVTFTVQNQGASPAQTGPFFFAWFDTCYLSSNATLGTEDPVLGEGNGHVTALAAGASYTASFNCIAPSSTAAGSYTLFVKADGSSNNSFFEAGNGTIAETNETNNVMSAPLALPTKPDLAVSNLSIGAVTKNANGSYTFPATFTVTNIGGSTAPAGSWGWFDYCYLSGDGILSAEDAVLGSSGHGLNPLAPNASYSVTLSCTTPAPTTAGAYTVFVKTDANWNGLPLGNGFLTETNKANNVMSAPVKLP